MKTISLTQGRVALVDDADYKTVSSVKWSYSSCGYAMRSVGRKIRLYMHREIAGARSGEIVDHINGDPLDNRRSNLRLGDKCLNSINRSPQSNNKSGYRGVDFDRKRRKWCARIKTDGKQRFLGRFASLNDALAARRSAETEYLSRFPSIERSPR